MDKRIEELLVDWELARQEGTESTPEQLCADCPELLPEFRRQVESLSSMEWILDSASTHQVETKRDATENSAPPVASNLSADELATGIARLNLVTADDQLQVSESLSELKDHSQTSQKESAVSATEFAEHLVSKKLITQFQANRLLAERGASLVLDRYIIQDLIDQGGMGLVYKARHTSMDRIVAIKLLPEQLHRVPERAARFEREIKAIAQLSHPNIVTAFDAHQVDGKFFLAMEYVKGQNLWEVVQENGPLPAEEACKLVDQVAQALHQAHQKGIVHRDVKPSNILLSDSGEARLLDLGLAQFIYSVGEVSTSELTDVGVPMGTVSYMAPEQAIDASSANELSDIYSLGCTLHFLITGKPPFQRSNSVQTLMAHRQADIPALTEHISPEDLPANLQ